MFANGLILCILFFLQVCISFGALSILRVTFGEFEKQVLFRMRVH